MTSEKKPTHPAPRMGAADLQAFIENLGLPTTKTSNLIHAQTSIDDRRTIILAIAAEVDTRFPIPTPPLSPRGEVAPS
jgi:hypothetical protein